MQEMEVSELKVEWNDALEAEISEEMSALVLPAMNGDEVADAIKSVVNTMKDVSSKISESANQALKRRIEELEAHLVMESELRALTESYQSEMETYIENLRNMNVQPRKNVSKNRSVNLFKKEGSSSFDQYELKITQLEAQNEYLKKEMESLQEKYTTMVDSRAILFFEKEYLKLELETLTRDLFEEANKMVANESRLRAELQSSNQKLSQELENALESLRLTANAQKEKYLQKQRKTSDQFQSPGFQSPSPNSPPLRHFLSPSPDEITISRARLASLLSSNLNNNASNSNNNAGIASSQISDLTRTLSGNPYHPPDLGGSGGSGGSGGNLVNHNQASNHLSSETNSRNPEAPVSTYDRIKFSPRESRGIRIPASRRKSDSFLPLSTSW